MRSRRKSRQPIVAESLERRLLLAFDPTAQEQEMLELINNMRIDPQGHLNTLFSSTNPLVSRDADSNQSMQFFGVNSANFLPAWQTLTAAAPLTWNEAVYNATRTHNLLVLQNDAQEHQFPGEPNVGQRITNAGYTDMAGAGENLFSFSKSVFHGHSGLAIDWGVPSLGHRNNIMHQNLTEVGISIIAQTQTGKNVGPLAIGQNFATTFTPKKYITGAVYNDTDANGRYTAGEGLGGVTITVTGGTGGPVTTTTMTAGGYRVEVPDGTYTVTMSGGGLTAPKTFNNVVIAGANKKVDSAAAATVPGPDASGKPYFIAAVGSGLTTELQNGQTIATLLATGTAGTQGLALSAVDNTLGTWQYTLVASPQTADWINVDAAGALSTTNALLLPDTARLRFVTTLKPHHTGTTATGFLPLETKLENALTYRTWDKSTGTAAGRADSTTGAAFGTTDIVAQTYFEARLFRSFNPNAELNVYTLQAEFEVLTTQVGYQDRSTAAFSGFTVFLSALPVKVTTAPLYRMYFGVQFNDDGTETDMGYRYLTPSTSEASTLEGLGRADKRAARDGAYFREQGVNSGTAALGYIYTTAQPGTVQMSQVYRTDQFPKPRRTGTTPAGTVAQEQGDHVYTTETAFEMGKKGTWRQEATRGFVRELSTSQGRAGGAVQPVVAASSSPETVTLFGVPVSFSATAALGDEQTADTSSLASLVAPWTTTAVLIVGPGSTVDSSLPTALSAIATDEDESAAIDLQPLDLALASWTDSLETLS